jgi:hypothetical protein
MRGRESLRLGTINHSLPLRKPRYVEVGHSKTFYTGSVHFELQARPLTRFNGLKTEVVDVSYANNFSNSSHSLRIEEKTKRLLGKTRLPGVFHLFSRDD